MRVARDAALRSARRAIVKVVLVCVECGKACHAPWPESAVQLVDFMHTLWRECRYVMSAVSGEEKEEAAGHDTRELDCTCPAAAATGAASAMSTASAIATSLSGSRGKRGDLLAPLCEACAELVYGKAIMRVVRRDMEKRNY